MATRTHNPSTMAVSQKGIAEIACHEAIILSPYLDSVGVWTVGVGHTSNAGRPDPAKERREFSLAEVMSIFARDIRRFEGRVRRAFTRPLTQYQFDAAVSFDFNTGGIFRASWVKKFNNGDDAGARKSFMSWSKPTEIVPRRTKEQALFFDGRYSGDGWVMTYPATTSGRVEWSKGRRVRLPNMVGADDQEAPEAWPVTFQTLRHASRGEEVFALQRSLKMLGYQPGGIDGYFGKLTRAAVLEFQADNHLIADGIVGPATWEALMEAQPRQLMEAREQASLFDLAGRGSRIATASIGNTVAGGAITAGGALSVLEQSSGAVSRVASSLGVFKDSFQSFGVGLGIVVLAVGIFVVFQAVKSGRARVDDHRKGKTL